MAWDFETEPEFEEQLVWMRGFMREEIMPIETLDLSHDQALAFIKPLQDQVRERGLWAAHLPQELGGTGFGQVRLGLMHEILGQTPYGPVVFGSSRIASCKLRWASSYFAARPYASPRRS